ncbi:DUF465 domain-containing protein [Proteus vulgaris]|uniref:DUF465 domain-containing protein n=1 Tax=Proteus vulgaris TaxID=585 RepID=UPI002873F623|nr:DUF465 domain-containing protein [Proteus vulgaris]MDS0787652.1 DUF465 domain-containing protein [Proteus vulgaris]
MFSDQQALVSQLRNSDPRFQTLYDKHHRLNQEIAKLEGPNGAGYNDEVVKLKKEKLHLKDEMQKILQRSEK